MVINNLKFRASLVLALFLCCQIAIFAQNTNKFPEFKKYKTWGYHVSPVVYSKATTKKTQGTLDMKNLPMQTWGFGFTKLIKPENKISFKTGLYIEVTPLYNYDLKINKEDLFGAFSEKNYDERFNKSFYRTVLTIPTLVQFKMQLSDKTYFNLESGIQTVLFISGRFDTTNTLSDYNVPETREVFGLYGETYDANWLAPYPNLVISPGFYFTLDKMLIQANFIYQKTLLPYYKGEYLYDNLNVSPRSRGTYKLSGDYIGLSFNVHLLKKTKQKTMERET